MTTWRFGWAMLLLVSVSHVRADGTSCPPAAVCNDHREAAAALDKAIVAKDLQALQALLADDFLWVRGSGATGDKAAFIAALTAPSLTIEPFVPGDVHWIVAGDAALLAATTTLRGTADGEAFVDRHRFADHWVRRDGRWQLTYAQVTRLPEPGSD